MNLKPEITVIGGDTRQYYTAARLSAINCKVKIFGLELCENPLALCTCKNLTEALKSRVIILPLPFSRNGKTLNTPFCNNEILISEIVERLDREKILFTGKGNATFQGAVMTTGCKYIDYFLSEELTVKNALLTAEGVLSIILEKLPVTVFGLNTAIIGYGRLGYFTAKLLKALGARVTVFARNETQLAKAECAGMNVCSINNLINSIHSFSCLINTVPAPVITKGLIDKMDKNTLLIETASEPYGIDFSAAENRNIQLIKAFSLPGKTAPVTAGKIIAETVYKKLGEVYDEKT